MYLPAKQQKSSIETFQDVKNKLKPIGLLTRLQIINQEIPQP